MTATVGYGWRLREVMASHGVWKTTDLGPLLAERGVVLSAAQVYRLVAQVPERLSLRTLAALCDIFGVGPDQLINVNVTAGAASMAPTPVARGRSAGSVVELAATGRPRRARVAPNR
jgi:DNA-binding Xre family transcriptional regulator